MSNEYRTYNSHPVCGIWHSAVPQLPNLRQHRNRIHRNCHLQPVLGPDYIHHHAEDEQRRGEFLPACHPPLHPGRQHHEQRRYRQTPCKLRKAVRGLDSMVPWPRPISWVNMLFGALSGSSVAAASAMGGCIYPIQKDEGYDPAFATAVNIASAPPDS